MKTPLYDLHVKLGARMAPFGGWDMPIQYEGILAEHQQTRTRASVFDICHMGEFELTGPTAAADLDRLLTQSISTLHPGQCRYGYLLNGQGGVLDDLTCYNLGPDRYWLVVNAATTAKDAQWISARVSPRTLFKDLSPRIAKLDIQGPTSRADMEEAMGVRLPDLRYFYAQELDWRGARCLLSRTGYTGEWGYELYFPMERAVEFWEVLTAPGKIRPGGLGARDTLRLEVAYPLYGHELGEEQTPVSASRGAFLDLAKEFTGRTAVARDLETGCPEYLAGLRLDTKRAARAGDVVYADGAVAGRVTSGSLAPSLNVAVALAFVRAELCSPGVRLEVESHGRRLAATVVELPFYKDGTARKKV